MSETYQVHNLHGDVAVCSVQDRIGLYIDEELEAFRSDDRRAEFCIQASPLAALDGKLHRISELREIQYLIHKSTQERYVGYRDVYWRFDELGDPRMHVFYGPRASAHGVWTIVEQWIKIAFLQREWLGIHSCAFVYQDMPVVVVGWQDLGKSRLLHYALARGAAYVSDDFTWLSASGQIRGYPPAAITETLRPRSHYVRDGMVGKVIGSVPGLSKAANLVRRIVRELGYKRSSVQRVRMDVLYPGARIVLRTSAAVWVILLPNGDWPQKICANAPVSEIVERVITCMLTDYYFAQFYDRYLYQSGHRPKDDHLILNARTIHREVLSEALSHARAIWTVDSKTVLSDPGSLLARINDVDVGKARNGR